VAPNTFSANGRYATDLYSFSNMIVIWKQIAVEEFSQCEILGWIEYLRKG
jgi:hypothetical protein